MDLGFNTDDPTIEESTGRGGVLIPNGEYNTVCVGADMREAQNKVGETYRRISLRWEVLDGQFAGQPLFDDVIIDHSNPDKAKAATIGRGIIKRIANASGGAVSRTEDLLTRKVRVRVVVEEPDADGKAKGWKPRSSVKGYKKMEGASAATTSATTSPTAAVAASANARAAAQNSKPW